MQQSDTSTSKDKDKATAPAAPGGAVAGAVAPPLFRIGVAREIYPGERRVAATPATVHQLRKLGVEVLVQSGAGEGASILDAEYAEAGAHLVPTAAALYQTADLVIKVRAPMALPEEPALPRPLGSGRAATHEVELLREGTRLISFIWPAQNPELLELLAARKPTVLAMDMVPRVTRAQKLDALSAMANIAGYKAVIEAAHHYGRFLGGQVTAAGRVKPAQVLVIGAGVAGLAAVAAARSLGAVVWAFDTRPAVREQVESLGAQFIEFQFNESGEGEGGYAKQMSEAYLAAEQALIATHCATSDIVITTALIPGTAAPKLITSGAVVGMARGSVIVDLAAEQGGNCALTERDRIVEKFGVKIIGQTDLTSQMARQSSELYAGTLLNLLKDLIKEGRFTLDREDEVLRNMMVLDGGKLTWPPPRPVLRSGAPEPRKEPPRPSAMSARPENPWPMRVGLLFAALVLVPIGLYAPPQFLQHFTVFLLACIVGWHVVWNVTPALHTPLMSVTNAISGIILIGGLLLGRGAEVSAATVLGALAVLLSTINVAGGFLVTQRMLRMFRK
jgi:NAD(P) transhydrogenase subunit alpha